MDYAQATLPYNSTGYALIQLEMGYLLCTSFNWDWPTGLQTVCKALSQEEAYKYTKQLQEAQELTCKNLEKA